eukprot:CAMPEP_0115304712 /NCGR_PEP_ID=MMETSP0270-20121206/71616_1 /TAXON_ID=71861 /ORGANISM="Scrippsiella trochoidea, Strain CCMP3099" /LENGTH=79 /DNA_ID=CAMNT_0002722831 /DNA_START=25 /DNA_END=261 /DNA_ORIENTATION=-
MRWHMRNRAASPVRTLPATGSLTGRQQIPRQPARRPTDGRVASAKNTIMLISHKQFSHPAVVSEPLRCREALKANPPTP